MLIDIEHRSFEETLRRCEELGGVDLIFTSPPYPTEKPGAAGAAGAPTRDYGGDAPKHFAWEDYQRLGDLCYRALKPGGFCIIIIDGPVRILDKQIGSERSTIAFKLAEDWRWTKRQDGLRFRYVEHETYLRDGIPGAQGPRRRSGFELMHVFQRPGGAGFFDRRAILMPATSGRTRSTTPTSRSWRGKTTARPCDEIRTTMRCLTTAITCNPGGPVTNDKSQDPQHQAPFTSWIAMVQVLSYSAPGALVCDPFVGSGTTAIAASRSGRSFIGGDLGARVEDGVRWAVVAKERALEAAGQPAATMTKVQHEHRRRGAARRNTPPVQHESEQLDLLG